MADSPDHSCGRSGGGARSEVGSALRSPAAHARFWAVTIVGLVADLWSKHWAFTSLDPDHGIVVIRHLARLQRSLNTGALFGLGKGWTPLFIVASILALAFVLYLFAHSGRERWSLHVALGLVLAGALGNLYDRAFEIADVVKYTDKRGQSRVEAGIIDRQQSNERYLALGSYPECGRLTFLSRESVVATWQQGVVRDFIKMEPRIPLGGGRSFEVWPWVYNIADVLLVVGVAILMINFWKERRAARTPVETAETATKESRTGP